jgi:hypothetical protein
MYLLIYRDWKIPLNIPILKDMVKYIGLGKVYRLRKSRSICEKIHFFNNIIVLNTLNIGLSLKGS